jgi:hypothetical protein
LAPDAILCETDAPLALLSEANLTNQPGSVVMKRVAATAEFYALKSKFDARLGQLAAEERDIYKDSRYPNRGATASRMDEARANQQKSDSERKRYADFASKCVATADKEQSAIIIERRPISRISRVRTQFNGQEHDLWTHDFYLIAR